jgi:hypothetical protein
MAKGIFEFHITAKNQKESTIQEIAFKLIDLYNDMAFIDEIFNNANIYVSNNRKRFINFSSIDKNVILKMLSESILSYNLKDIQRFDNVTKPSLNYRRDYGFRCVIEFGDEKQRIHLSHVMGSNNYVSISSIADINFQLNFDRDFYWYYNVLKTYINKLNVLSGVVRIATSAFINATSKFSFPLGWITYISNENEIKIPNSLEGFEYEFTDRGTFIISDRHDFTINKDITRVY